VSSVLESACFQVVTASSSETALRKLYQTHPDIVIIIADDLARTQELCYHIRGICNIPIVVLGDGDGIARAMMLEMGADVCLVQPVNPAELVAWVHSLLRRYKRSNSGNPILDPPSPLYPPPEAKIWH